MVYSNENNLLFIDFGINPYGLSQLFM